jgi:hypothetical protein
MLSRDRDLARRVKAAAVGGDGQADRRLPERDAADLIRAAEPAAHRVGETPVAEVSNPGWPSAMV